MQGGGAMSEEFLGGRGKHVPINYTPSFEHIQWAKQMVRLLNDGGRGVVPANNTVYEIDRVNMRISLVAGEIDDWFYKNIILFRSMGYEVVDGREKI
jgi:hypothetical protein